MAFLNFFMIVGGLAAGIPVLIHLFFRSRYRTVPWAAMKFLLTSVEQTSRRLKFQELILLLLRMLVLALLAFASMRPVTSMVRGTGRGDAVDAVFVIDTSYSMGANDGDGKTRLGRAKEEAIKIIEELPPHSTVQIITCSGNQKTLLGPRTPANLDQARDIVQRLDITHLATDLAHGVIEAKSVLTHGQAPNKEFYLFSDMQKLGFEQQAGTLKKILGEIKNMSVVHVVRCGTQPVKNVAIVGITPQSGVPRPSERVGFAVLVRNSGADPLENLTVSLAVDGDEKNADTAKIAKIKPGETHAVTLTGKLKKAGLHVLTAKVGPDDLEADNRFDQVIQVREQVNILVVDGSHNERDPAKSSSFFLMHALLPVKDAERAGYHLQPRVVPARLASPALLAKQDICILVNCSLQTKLGLRAETLPGDFVDALGPFVREQGRGLVIFAGDNVQPEPYNKLLGKKLGLLPLPFKPVAQAAESKPFLIDRKSFGIPSFWKFKDDDYYKDFARIEVWQALGMDESGLKEKDKQKQEGEPIEPLKKDEDPVSVVVRLNTGQPLVAVRKVDAGEVIVIGTAANVELNEKTANPSWTDWPFRLGMYVPFVDVTMSHLLHGQTQTYNLVAGETLNWYPTSKQDFVYSLRHPDGKLVRLGQPEKVDRRLVVVASDLPRAGIYHVIAQPRGTEGSETTDAFMALKGGTPIAVVPDERESADLTALGNGAIDEWLGFTPIHITAGVTEGSLVGADRLNREWTVWVLLAVLGLVLFEVVLAWWCGRAW